MPTTLHLVRHAEPADAGHGLSQRGHRQVRLLGHRLAGLGDVTAIHHGPSTRTTLTARLLADVLEGTTLHEAAGLRDLTPSPLPGEEHRYPARLRTWLEGVASSRLDPGGRELSRTLQHFAVAGGTLALVTHAFVIGWFVREAIDAPPHRWMELFADHAGLTTISVPDDDRPPALVRFNDTGHLTAD